MPGPRYIHPFAQDHARYLRATALRGVGEDAEAVRWLRYGFHLTPGEFIYADAVAEMISEIETRGVPHR